jgi:N-acetylglutamate synthase-like GNAT family acetyltransferase
MGSNALAQDELTKQGMNSYRTRRATVDDLAQLAELWRAANLPVIETEKRFTDFQIAEDENGKLAAAIGLHIEDSHGRIHSEAFIDSALADTLRPILWARLQVVVQNHGLFRLWTQEAAPWWKETAGFSAAPEDLMQKLPGVYGPRQAAWLTLRLKDERAEPDLLEQQIAMFKESERVDLDRLLRRGKILKVFAVLISAVLLLLALMLLFLVWKRRR